MSASALASAAPERDDCTFTFVLMLGDELREFIRVRIERGQRRDEIRIRRERGLHIQVGIQFRGLGFVHGNED